MSITITFANTENEYFDVNKKYTTVKTCASASIVYPCDILAPTFKIKGGKIDANAVTNVFGRNYWITSQTLNEGINYVSCTVDAFSSHNGNLNGSTQFVARSEKHGNPMLNDANYPNASNSVVEVIQGDLLTENLSYIIGVI
mgnify:CR=1 FL=1